MVSEFQKHRYFKKRAERGRYVESLTRIGGHDDINDELDKNRIIRTSQ